MDGLKFFFFKQLVEINGLDMNLDLIGNEHLSNDKTRLKALRQVTAEAR